MYMYILYMLLLNVVSPVRNPIPSRSKSKSEQTCLTLTNSVNPPRHVNLLIKALAVYQNVGHWAITAAAATITMSSTIE